MAPQPPIAPPQRPAPPFRPTPRVAAGVWGGGVRMVPWGWLEWTILSQTLLPALLFVPGMSAVRIVTRVGVYAIALLAWVALLIKGRRPPGGGHPSTPWLLAASVWLVLSLANPGLNSPASGLAQIVVNLAILAPAFWGASALISRRQVGRVMAILLLCNSASALMGIGQVLRPNTFNPPDIRFIEGMTDAENQSYEGANGQMIMRPCGLTDSPGIGASSAGLMAALLGVGWTLRPMATWKRLGSLGLAMAGLILIYFSQVRVMLLILVGSLATLMGLMAVQRQFRKLTQMGAACALIFVASLAWVASVGGEGALARFQELLEEDPTKTFDKNRGNFLTHTFAVIVPDYPLGAGLGRWGPMHAYFGDKRISRERGQIWVEIQITGWAVDGGVPLMVVYVVALGFALYDLGRIALRSRDPDIAYWAAVVFALDLGIVVSSLGMPTFVIPLGLQFWVLAAAVSAADHLVPVSAGMRRPLFPASP